MKKLYITIISMAIVVIMNNSVFAEVETIGLDKAAPRENNEVIIDTTNLMCDSQPVYGNGMYLQVNGSGKNPDSEEEYDISVPNQYKLAGFSNSPIYIYDSELNYIKSVEFDNFISGIRFIDGYFYISKSIYGGENIKVEHYKGREPESLIEISDREYTLSVHSKDLYNGMKYTWEKYSYSNDGMIVNTTDRLEYLVDNNDMYQIEREYNKYIYLKSDVQASNLYVYVKTTRNLDDYNDLSNCSKSISLDGVSMVDIPKDSDIENIWNDDTFLYIGKSDDQSLCYRIPIEQLTNYIKIKYNGKYLSFATPPTMEDDRTLVPMRFLFEQMRADVDWEGETQTATVEKGNDKIAFSINNTAAKVNNTIKTMDVPARLINSKTMIPLRFLSEELGYTVEWDQDTKTVTISD